MSLIAMQGGLMSAAVGANTVVLLHMDGTNGSTSFPDDAGNTWTAAGDAQVSTASPQFGTGALLLDGTGDWLSTPQLASMQFGTGPFTVEAWINTSIRANSPTIISTRRSAPVGGFTFRLNSSGQIQYFFGNGAPIGAAGPNLADGAWHHVAYSRDGTSGRLFADGALVTTLADSSNHISSSSNATTFIGRSAINTTENFNGQIDEVRISRIARYTAAFTPSGPFVMD